MGIRPTQGNGREIPQECLGLCLLDCLAKQPLGQSSVDAKEGPFR